MPQHLQMATNFDQANDRQPKTTDNNSNYQKGGFQALQTVL